MRALDIVTGPSGAGKSTFIEAQADWTNVWNLDTLERRSHSRVRALKLMNEGIQRDIRDGRPLIIDHIVDSEAIRCWIEPAKRAGYTIRGRLLGNDHRSLHVTRVRQRRRAGGHGASNDIVQALHHQALSGFGELTVLCDQSFLVDTGTRKPRVLGIIQGFAWAKTLDRLPAWADELTTGLPAMRTSPDWTAAQRRVAAAWC